MESRNRRLESTAHHEAGHTVVYFELGKRIRKVTIVPIGDRLGCCFGYTKIPQLEFCEITPSIRDKIDWEITNNFVGALAEKRFLGRRPKDWTKLTDTRDAIKLAGYLTGSNEELDAYLNWLYVRAKGFIYNRENPWKAIQAIARELLEKRTLSGDEAFQIWQSIYQMPVTQVVVCRKEEVH